MIDGYMVQEDDRRRGVGFPTLAREIGSVNGVPHPASGAKVVFEALDDGDVVIGGPQEATPARLDAVQRVPPSVERHEGVDPVIAPVQAWFRSIVKALGQGLSLRKGVDVRDHAFLVVRRGGPADAPAVEVLAVPVI